MKILVLGGSGFIGYHIVDQCLASGLEVSSVDLIRPKILPSSVTSHILNVNESHDDTLIALFSDYDVIVDTLGADDRVVPKKPAYAFFHKANVEDTERLLLLSKKAGIRRFIVLSSYFCHVNEAYPELNLSNIHPYIKSRCKQSEVALSAASDEFFVNVIMLPFVFGVTPGVKPLWYKSIRVLKYLSYFPIGIMAGGTNVVSVKTVGKSVAAAVITGAEKKAYLVGGKNIPWSELLRLVSKAFNRQPKIYQVDIKKYTLLTQLLQLKDRLQGKESGLNKALIHNLLRKNLFFDAELASQALGYEIDCIEDAINETVIYCEQLSQETTK